MKRDITTKEVPALVNDIQSGKKAPVYLIHGDAFLCTSALKKIVSAIIPEDRMVLNYELLDGATTSVDEIIGRINTFPLIPGDKIVAVQGIPFFYSKKNSGQILEKAKQAIDKEDEKKAARYFVDALSTAGLSLDDVKDGHLKGLQAVLEGMGAGTEKGGWLDRICTYCLANNITVSNVQGADVRLHEAMTAGFPESNSLVLIADAVDKRKKLYKAIKKAGVVIDCTISKGSKAADRRQQEAFFRSQMKEVLAASGKSFTSGAFEALFEKTGPELRVFHHELERLVTYVGDRKQISASDIEKTTTRTRQDPIYELSNALAEKNLSRTLSLMKNLFEADLYPLQILAAVINQVRKLIFAKDLSRKVLGKRQTGTLEYRTFQSRILPEMQRQEENPLAHGVHPFVLYKSLGHAENFTMQELAEAMKTCLEADIQLKSGGQDGKLVLERVVMHICRP